MALSFTLKKMVGHMDGNEGSEGMRLKDGRMTLRKHVDPTVKPLPALPGVLKKKGD